MYIEPNPFLPAGPRPRLIEPALAALLDRSMLKVRVVAELHRCGTWQAEAPSHDCGFFHLVGSGQCTMRSEELAGPVALSAGDLVVFPHGASHRLHGVSADTAHTSLICGEFRFTGSARHPLSMALPSCMVIRGAQASAPFRQLATTMTEVVHANYADRHVLLNKLADALFTVAILDYSHTTTDRQGLFASLADPRIARVLHAVHDNPGQIWTMQTMALLACMSRSAFAERFTHLMKVPPIQYLTQWRVSVAEQLLRDRQQSVAGIAQQLGYSSEAAFRRLFKRVSGTSPGRVRGEGDRPAMAN